MDSVDKQRLFSDKFLIPFDLLSDSNGALCNAFQVSHLASKPNRETFLFRRGRLIWHSPVAKTDMSDVFRALKYYQRHPSNL